MRNNVYRNSEGYYDPTAGAAIASADKKRRAMRRKAARKQRRKNTVVTRTIIYNENGEEYDFKKGDRHEWV